MQCYVSSVCSIRIQSGDLGCGFRTDLGSKLQRLIHRVLVRCLGSTGLGYGLDFCDGGGIPGRRLVDLDIFIHILIFVDVLA